MKIFKVLLSIIPPGPSWHLIWPSLATGTNLLTLQTLLERVYQSIHHVVLLQSNAFLYITYTEFDVNYIYNSSHTFFIRHPPSTIRVTSNKKMLPLK